VVPDASLQEEALALARSLAEGPAVALGLMKDNLDEAARIDYLTALDREAERMIECQATADHREAVRAFIDKRRPKFSGA
jgi:enoyl-CoA hydratase/carnithine racemase